MDRQAAINLITDTFNSSFNENRFRHFIRNLFNDFDENKNASWITGYIKDSFKDHVKKYKRIGKYKDIDGNKLDVVVVHLRKESALDSARTMQRNFIASYLKTRGEKDAAVVAYFTDNTDDWRFSYVRMEYKQKITESGKIKVKEEFTSRRYSFLVGKNEPNHTAQQQLLPILQSDSSGPTLKEIEKAFDIETVTKEFFIKYRELFLHTKEELDRVVKKDPKIKADFESKGVDTVNFAKKLLGQIIFLYFLQKKGWFGVGRDDDWGTGSKHFLRELFEKKHGDYKNLFNDILEPLFYDALRNDRSHDDGYYSRFNCKIPFLNGGLFDPIGNYDWVHIDIFLPNKLFSNQTKTKEGDKGTGILDIFDRYNFTVKEDEPLEKEVAIDPELLGKSYEKFNAIRQDNFAEFKKALKSGKKGEENKFNKKFGVYYTPREIVHYMCQQSLINYLHTEVIASEAKQSLIPSKEDIEALIHTGEQVSENEARVLSKGKETKTYSHQLPESIRRNAKQIDDKLAEITVCDPAVGSGAFPVGMMSEIVKTRNVLSVFLNDKGRTAYNFKRRCIEHSLYGVDIDPGAVEIAKLRLWLSLVVDEDDIKNIKPLPNLDYRIMQGNSLISEFMGINFDSDKEKKSENLLFKDETDKLIEQFQQKKDKFLNESNVSRKSILKEEVDNLLVTIFETKLRTQKADYFNRLKNIENKYSVVRNEKQRDELIKQDKDKLNKKFGLDLESAEKQLKEFTSGKKIKPFFLWNLYFSEVFHNKGGFDVVIANPPYVVSKDKVLKIIYKDSIYGRPNLYGFFIHKSLHLLSKQGILTFINPRTLLTDAYSSALRRYILNHGAVLLVLNIVDRRNVFESVLQSTIVNIISRNTTLDIVRVKSVRTKEEITSRNEIQIKKEDFTFGNQSGPTFIVAESEITYSIFRKLAKLPSFSQAGLIFTTGKVQWDLYKNILSSNPGKSAIRLVWAENIQRFHFAKTRLRRDKLFINGVLKAGSPIKHQTIIVQRTTAVEQRFRIIATIVNPVDFGYPIQSENHTSYLESNTKSFNLNLVVAILNSRFLDFVFRHINSNTQVSAGELNGLPFSNNLSICNATIFINLVHKITTAKKATPQADTSALEAEIDQLVYKLYDLTPEEIKIVEGD